MPMYDYTCKNCGTRFEIQCRMTDSRKSVRCPRCKGRKVAQVLGSFTALGLSSKRPSKRGASSNCANCTSSSCSGCSR